MKTLPIKAKTRKAKALRPITRKIVFICDDKHIGWSLYIEDYERAITAMGDVIYDGVLTSGDAPANCARKALAAIGIESP